MDRSRPAQIGYRRYEIGRSDVGHEPGYEFRASSTIDHVRSPKVRKNVLEDYARGVGGICYQEVGKDEISEELGR